MLYSRMLYKFCSVHQVWLLVLQNKWANGHEQCYTPNLHTKNTTNIESTE